MSPSWTMLPRRAALATALALLGGGCSDGRTLIVLRVAGAPAAAATLQVALTLDRAPAQEELRFRSDGRALGLRLPAGSRGLLHLAVTARSDDASGGCALARGARDQPIAGEQRLDLDVTLATLATPECPAKDGGPDLGLGDLGAPAPLDLGGQPCQREADCGDGSGLSCRGQRCQPCAQHGDCESAVCDAYLATALGPGRCLPEAGILYVFNSPGAACHSGSGARGAPLCTLAEAVARAQPGAPLRVRLLASSKPYDPLSVVTGVTVSIYGPAGEGGGATLEHPAGPAASVSGGAEVLLDGVTLSGATHALLCEAAAPPPGPSVTLRRSTARLKGIEARDYCQVVLERVLVRTGTFGVAVSDRTAAARVSNSLLWDSQDVVTVAEGGALTVRFSTIVNNRGLVACGPRVLGAPAQATTTIEDSIVFGNSAIGGSQLQRCTVKNSVVGQLDSAPGGILLDPVLDSQDQRLLPVPANQACCIDRALGAIASDLQGRPRPQRQGYDIGAIEVP